MDRVHGKPAGWNLQQLRAHQHNLINNVNVNLFREMRHFEGKTKDLYVKYLN